MGDEEDTNITMRKIRLPVIELPRTEYKKPYIPLLIQDETNTTTVRATSQRIKHSALTDEEIADAFPISVSHQYPHVGLARLVEGNSSYFEEKKKDKSSGAVPNSNQLLKLGMDIVVIEPYNKRMYSSAENFLEVFKESFTSWEWNRIRYRKDANQSIETNHYHPRLFSKKSFGYSRGGERGGILKSSSSKNVLRSDDDLLQEFYLRWSIKEAYTKALGVGMGLDFKSFETRLLDGIDNDDDGQKRKSFLYNDTNLDGIYDFISQRCEIEHGKEHDVTSSSSKEKYSGVTQNDKHKRFKVRGKVTYLKVKKEELWDFWFVPLPDGDDDKKPIPSDVFQFKACACVCLGPLLSPSSTKGSSRSLQKQPDVAHNASLSVRSMKLKDVIDWHTCERS